MHALPMPMRRQHCLESHHAPPGHCMHAQNDLRMEGCIIGFDEYMNLVLDEAEEVSMKRKTRKPLGRILLKGDNITLMQTVGKAT